MKFPNKLILTLKSSTNSSPVPNRAIHLLIRAPRKNNYDVGLKITNESGQAVYTEQEIINEIEWTRSSFIMDYSSSYEECFSDFSVVLFSMEGVQKCTEALKLYMSFGERIAKNFELIQLAQNTNAAQQQWDFDTDKLTIQNGIAHIECLVDGV